LFGTDFFDRDRLLLLDQAVIGGVLPNEECLLSSYLGKGKHQLGNAFSFKAYNQALYFYLAQSIALDHSFPVVVLLEDRDQSSQDKGCSFDGFSPFWKVLDVVKGYQMPLLDIFLHCDQIHSKGIFLLPIDPELANTVSHMLFQ